MTSAKFELEPKAVGDWTYAVKVLPLTDDVDEKDNVQQVSVTVIERKNRVLIFAGGPTREYQFVRNLLFRDRDVESHVLLQTGKAGISQEAQKVIDAAVQMHGGLGVTVGAKVEELYREIRALRIYEGASEVQRQIIARDLLKEHRA